MTQKPDKTSSPHWWQSQLVIIREKQTAYLRQHLPVIRADHEDLVGDTVLALTRQILDNPSEYPLSWFEPAGPKEETERAYLYKLATVILKRRIADLFRKRQREMRYVSNDEDPSQNVVDPNTEPPDRKILLVRLLKVTSLVLDEMPVEDRDLIAFVANKEVRKAVNPRDRKRLERIRKKLRDEISRRLGANVQDLLITL